MAREPRSSRAAFNWRLLVGNLRLRRGRCVHRGGRLQGQPSTSAPTRSSLFPASARTRSPLQGLVYASRFKVQRVFAADFEHSVFSVPLAERRRRLLAIDWVEDASVSRVWPDRLVVRIRERKPVAFVSFRSGVC